MTIKILLVKADWCGYCRMFVPIFNKAKEILRNKDSKFELTTYEFADEKQNILDKYTKSKKEFIDNYGNLEKKIEGYPTIFMIVNNKDYNINTTSVDENIPKDKQIEDAANKFINNILQQYKTVTSERKDNYIAHIGGNILNNDIIYRNKYIKYKSKYLELCNNK